MAGPWEKYQKPQETGPWSKYQARPEQAGDISVQTGKQLTPGEIGRQSASSKQALETVLPIAGDIAGTALAPQFTLPAKGINLLPRAANLISRMTGSGVGSFGGSALADWILGQDVDTEQAKQEAMTGAAGEAITSALGVSAKAPLWLGKKIGKPIINMAADFTRLGGVTSRQSAKVLNKTRQRIMGETTEHALDFTKRLGTKTKTETGMEIGEALRKKIDWNKVYKEPNAIIDLASKTGKGDILLENAQESFQELVKNFMGQITPGGKQMGERQAIDEAIKWLGFTSTSKEGRMLREFYFDEAVRGKDVNYLIKRIWKTYGDDPKKVVDWKEGFKRNITEDIQRLAGESVDFVGSLQKADKIFGETNNWFRQNPTAKSLIDKMQFGRADRLYFEEYPERAVERILKSSPEQISNIRKAIIAEEGGKEAWAGLEMNYLRDIYRQAMREAPDTGKVVVQPAKLANLIYESEKTVKAVNPGLWQPLKKEADYYLKISSQFEAIDTTTGMDVFKAWGILSPRSKKFVERLGKEAVGLTRRATKAGLHLGGQQVFTNE